MTDRQHCCIVMAQNKILNEVFSFETAAELEAFRYGVAIGGILYGPENISLVVYTEDDVDRDLEANDIDWDTAQALRKALREVRRG